MSVSAMFNSWDNWLFGVSIYEGDVDEYMYNVIELGLIFISILIIYENKQV